MSSSKNLNLFLPDSGCSSLLCFLIRLEVTIPLSCSCFCPSQNTNSFIGAHSIGSDGFDFLQFVELLNVLDQIMTPDTSDVLFGPWIPGRKFSENGPKGNMKVCICIDTEFKGRVFASIIKNQLKSVFVSRREC